DVYLVLQRMVKSCGSTLMERHSKQLLHPLEHIVQTSLLCFILLARKLKPKVISKMTEVLWYLRDLHPVQKRLSLARAF
ncbi:hypothetical protein BTI60_08975, partial [Lactobacillus delbrueckii subsp. bulgaricus]|nr:hypothetical protein [Lactobacillus delbrueckii subsp. bulgaricus]